MPRKAKPTFDIDAYEHAGKTRLSEPLVEIESSDEDDDEARVRPLTKKQQAELLRQQVDTVGQIGKPGEQIQKVISVGMTQRIVFETARDVYDQMQHGWQGSKEVLLAQLVRLVEQFIRSDKPALSGAEGIAITPPLFYQDELRRRLIITLNMTRVVQHIWEAIRADNTEQVELVFDGDQPIRSTGDMGTWYTGKPRHPAQQSHINFCVFDCAWEAADAFELDHNPAVEAWVKNDHLGFEILYICRGVVRKYRPDWLIRLANGDVLILDTGLWRILVV